MARVGEQAVGNAGRRRVHRRRVRCGCGGVLRCARSGSRRRAARHPHAPRGARYGVQLRERKALDRRARAARDRVSARPRAGTGPRAARAPARGRRERTPRVFGAHGACAGIRSALHRRACSPASISPGLRASWRATARRWCSASSASRPRATAAWSRHASRRPCTRLRSSTCSRKRWGFSVQDGQTWGRCTDSPRSLRSFWS